jgi:hypothetical protein
MGGAPSHSTVQSFAAAATIALAATIVFVLNAGTPMRVIVRYKNKIFKLPQDDFVLEHAGSAWRAVPKSLDAWFVKYPSERVFDAREILGERSKQKEEDRQNTQQGRGKSITPGEEPQQRKLELKRKQKYDDDNRKLFLGVVLFPLFAFIYLLRFVFVNIFDMLKVIFYVFPRYPHLRRKLGDEDDGDDDEKSTLHGSAASLDRFKPGTTGKDKGKDGGANETPESKKEKKRRDVKNKEAKYRQFRLDEFVALPRIDDVAKHLEKGYSISYAMATRKEYVEGRKNELEKRKKAYLDAMSQLEKADPEKKDLDKNREGSEWKNADGETTMTGAESDNNGSHDDAREPQQEAGDARRLARQPEPLWMRIWHSLGFGHGNSGPGDVEAGRNSLRRRLT